MLNHKQMELILTGNRHTVFLDYLNWLQEKHVSISNIEQLPHFTNEFTSVYVRDMKNIHAPMMNK